MSTQYPSETVQLPTGAAMKDGGSHGGLYDFSFTLWKDGRLVDRQAIQAHSMGQVNRAWDNFLKKNGGTI